MSGLLLDTHALYWLVSGTEQLADGALTAIGDAQAAGRLFVSPISAWELSIAARKPAHEKRPRLGTTVSRWFPEAVRAVSAKVVAIGATIAIEAAEVPEATGHKDPGDCYLIATARVRGLSLATRDAVIRGLAENGYLDVVVC